MKLLDSASNLVAKLSHQLEIARQHEHQLIVTAIAEHSSLPDHYWQPRHRLEEKLRSAQKLREALE